MQCVAAASVQVRKGDSHLAHANRLPPHRRRWQLHFLKRHCSLHVTNATRQNASASITKTSSPPPSKGVSDTLASMVETFVDAVATANPPPVQTTADDRTLPGDFVAGERVNYIADSQLFPGSSRLEFGQPLMVEGVGRRSGCIATRISSWSSRRESVECEVKDLSRSPPPTIPGGFTLGEQVYFEGVVSTPAYLNDGTSLVTHASVCFDARSQTTESTAHDFALQTGDRCIMVGAAVHPPDDYVVCCAIGSLAAYRMIPKGPNRNIKYDDSMHPGVRQRLMNKLELELQRKEKAELDALAASDEEPSAAAAAETAKQETDASRTEREAEATSAAAQRKASKRARQKARRADEAAAQAEAFEAASVKAAAEAAVKAAAAEAAAEAVADAPEVVEAAEAAEATEAVTKARETAAQQAAAEAAEEVDASLAEARNRTTEQPVVEQALTGAGHAAVEAGQQTAAWETAAKQAAIEATEEVAAQRQLAVQRAVEGTNADAERAAVKEVERKAAAARRTAAIERAMACQGLSWVKEKVEAAEAQAAKAGQDGYDAPSIITTTPRTAERMAVPLRLTFTPPPAPTTTGCGGRGGRGGRGCSALLVPPPPFSLGRGGRGRGGRGRGGSLRSSLVPPPQSSPRGEQLPSSHGSSEQVARDFRAHEVEWQPPSAPPPPAPPLPAPAAYECLTDKRWAYERLLNATELPAVAVFRARQLRTIGLSVERLVGYPSSTAPRHPTQGRACGVPVPKIRKRAWDLVNKLVFRDVRQFVGLDGAASASSSASSTTSSSGGGWQATVAEATSASAGRTDAVIPSAVCPVFLAAQLQLIHPSNAAPSPHEVRALARQLAEASAAVGQYAQQQRQLWRLMLAKGRPLSDATLGVSCGAHPTDSASVLVKWANGEEGVHDVEMWRTHYAALRGLHSLHRTSCDLGGGAPIDEASSALSDACDGGAEAHARAIHCDVAGGLELTHIFVMALRYETLSTNKAAYQAALPLRMMKLLQRRLGCHHECYASPLNRAFSSFCSAFLDTDVHFGSRGSFFDFRPAAGSFECNPPFDAQSVVACLKHVHSLLLSSARPLSFVLTVPTLNGTGRAGSTLRSLGRFLRASIEVVAQEHGYLMGLQHRRQLDGGRTWMPTIPSTAYVIQNDAGASRWPLCAGFEEECRSAWAV